MEGFNNLFYASGVINDQPQNFDGVEVNGVSHDSEQKADADGRHPVVVDNENPEFFSAYVRHKDGRALSVADIGSHAEAVSWARQLADRYQAYGWTFTDLFAAMHH